MGYLPCDPWFKFSSINCQYLADKVVCFDSLGADTVRDHQGSTLRSKGTVWAKKIVFGWPWLACGGPRGPWGWNLGRSTNFWDGFDLSFHLVPRLSGYIKHYTKCLRALEAFNVDIVRFCVRRWIWLNMCYLNVKHNLKRISALLFLCKYTFPTTTLANVIGFKLQILQIFFKVQ